LNIFNDPPEPGYQYFLIRLRASYNGSGLTRFDSSALHAVGTSNVAHHLPCGQVIPDPLPYDDVFPGAIIEGNYCYSVRTSDAATLVLYYKHLFDPPIFFALR